MPSTQSTASYSESAGVFSQALSWLRHRNRLHAPTVTLANAIGSRTHVAKTVSSAQVAAARGSTPTPPRPPLRWSPATSGSRPPAAAVIPVPPSAAAVTEAAAVGDGAICGPGHRSRRQGISHMTDAWGRVNGRPPHRQPPHHDLVVDWEALDPQQQLALLPEVDGHDAAASVPPASAHPTSSSGLGSISSAANGSTSSRAARQQGPLALQLGPCPKPQLQPRGAMEGREDAAEADVPSRRTLEPGPPVHSEHSRSGASALSPGVTHGSLSVSAYPPPPAVGAWATTAVAATVAPPPVATAQTGAAITAATRVGTSAASGSCQSYEQLHASWQRPSGPARLGAAALSAAIRAVESLDELADLYDAHRDTFRSGHVSAALARLPHVAGLRRLTSTPRLTEPRHEALLAELLQRFEGHRAAGEYGTRDVSNVAWVLGTLGRRERAGLVSELAAHMLGLRLRHKLQQLAATSASAATDVDCPGDSFPAVTAADLAAADAPGHASDCTALDLSNMALGMAKAGVTSPSLWQQLTEVAAANIATPHGVKGFGCQETANFAWSLAQAHREFCRRASGGFDGSGAPVADPGGDPHGSTDAQWRGFAAWPAGGGAAAPPPSAVRTLHPAWRCWARPFVEDVLAPRVRLKLPAYSAQLAANAAWALAALGHADRGTAVAVTAAAARAAEAAAAGRAALAPAAIAMFVWALATMTTTQRGCSTGDSGSAGFSTSSSNIRCSERCDGSSDDGRNSNGSNSSDRSHSSSLSGAEVANDSSSSRWGSGSDRSRTLRTSFQPQPDPEVQIQGPKVLVELQESESLPARRGQGHAGSLEPVQQQQQQQRQLGQEQPGQPEQQRPQRRLSLPVDPKALLALSRAAIACMDRFTPQGLSNLLWGLGVLGFRSPREVQELATRAALLRLKELQPLGLATLMEDWARSRRHHPALFAAAAPLAAARVRDGGFRPRTLARLLQAYGAVGHADRRLFLAAAEALTADGAGGGSRSAPLDELSAAEVYQLACAYGKVGVAAPLLMDELLCRLARLLGGGAGRLPARAAGRLLCVLAVLGHRPATVRQCTEGAEADRAAAARAAFVALRGSVLDGLAGMTSRHALAAVWALVRLHAAGAPAVLRMARLLARRAAPGAGSLAAGLAVVARTPAVCSSPPALARFVWVLGNGAAAAAADTERLQAAAAAAAAATADADAEAAGGCRAAAMHGGSAAAEAEAAAAAFFELSRGLLAVAEVLLRGAGPRGAALPSEVLVALAEASAALLARAPPRAHGGETCDGSGDNTSAEATAARLYDMLRGCFLTVAELALRRDTAMDGGLTARELTALVHAMYDSGAAAARPALREAAAHHVMRRLAAAQASGASLHRTIASSQRSSNSTSSGSARPSQLLHQSNQPQQQMQHRRQQWQQQQQQRHPSAARLSPDDLARLLAAAARLQLFHHPVAQPAISEAVQTLVLSGCSPSKRVLCEPERTDRTASTAATVVVGMTASPPPPLPPSPQPQPEALPTLIPSPAVLLDVLHYCGAADGLAAQESEPVRAESGRGEGGSGRGGRQGLQAPPQRRPCDAGVGGGGAADAAASSGKAVQQALYSWAARQALPLLPWMSAETRAQVLAEFRSMPVGELIATNADDVGQACGCEAM